MNFTVLLATIFIACLLLSIPIAVSIGFASLITIYSSGILPLTEMAKSAFTAVDSFPLLAIPLYILAGALMQKGGLTDDIVLFARVLVGKSIGGLATVTVIACTLFAAISGSGPATTAAIGTILIPSMIKEGYNKDFAGAITASSGGIGIVIPPSIPMIIYGVTAQVSIVKLFIAGFIPGILLAFFLVTTSYVYCKKKQYRGIQNSTEKTDAREIVKVAYKTKWALMAPIIILGGIYAGVVTVTEASVVAVFYSLFIGFVVYKQLSYKILFGTLTYASRLTGVVLFILGASGVFGRLIAVLQIPQKVSFLLFSITENPILLLLMIVVFLIFVGMWMETLTQIIILVPIFLPIVKSLGIDPIHFGIIVVIAAEIGFETPPLGVNLFVAQEISGSSLEGISKKAILFAGAEITALILVTLLPQISLFLPKLLGY